MSAKDATGLIIGGEPRIDFLPPEVKAGKQARRTRRTLAGLVILVVAVCAGAYLFATTLAFQAQLRLEDEQALTQELLDKQAEFAEARTVTTELSLVENARRAGSVTEILWAEYLSALNATLPGETVIESFAVDSQTALESAPVTAVPLQNARVATITFTARMPQLATGDALLVNLRKLPGFADATVTTITSEEGLYKANVVLNVNAEAFAKRFFEAEKASAGADAEAEGASGDAPVGSSESVEGEE